MESYGTSLGFPCGSAGKEYTGNVGDLGLIPGLEKGKATHSSILGQRILGQKSRTRLSNFR